MKNQFASKNRNVLSGAMDHDLVPYIRQHLFTSIISYYLETFLHQMITV